LINEIGVLFVYHKRDDVTQNNFDCLRYHNQDTEIVPIYSGTQSNKDRFGLLPESFELSGQNEIARKWERYRDNPEDAWHNNDLLVYAWALNRFRRSPELPEPPMSWCHIESDTLVTLPIKDAFTRVADCNAVAASAFFPTRDISWFLKFDLDALGDLLPYMQGCAPLCGTLFSDKALKAMVVKYLEHPIDTFCELRIATLATACGYPLVPNPHTSGTLAWAELPYVDPKVPAIWHPVKRVVDWRK
jgi:hypothetical protein